MTSKFAISCSACLIFQNEIILLAASQFSNLSNNKSNFQACCVLALLLRTKRREAKNLLAEPRAKHPILTGGLVLNFKFCGKTHVVVRGTQPIIFSLFASTNNPLAFIYTAFRFNFKKFLSRL